MSKILVVAETADGKVRRATHSAITFAQTAAAQTNGSFAILVMGSEIREAATELASYGATAVIVVDDPRLSGYLAERYAPTVVAKAKDGFDVVVATASSFGKDLLPRVAAALDAGYAADVSGFTAKSDGLHYRRPMFAGNAYGWCKPTTPKEVVSVRQSEFPPAAPSSQTSPIESMAAAPFPGAASRIEYLSLAQVKSERPELTEAGVVVSGGRALKERFKEFIDPLADALGAAVGATRAACDAGFAPSDMQVGQTGKVVAPELYVAVGISGAIQHLAGMKGSKVIVAINKDPDAPIFQVADYGLVADLFQAVPELTREVKAARS